ncbi:MAG: hypothetical protein ABL916_19110 [Burkholderiaceae bacterium]
MNTDTTTDLTDEQADAIKAVAAVEQKQDTARAVAALASPLDQAMRRGNPRPRHAEESPFDVHDVMKTPNMAFDPANVTAHELFEELEGWGVGLAVDALKGAQDVVKNVIEAREIYQTDPTLTQAAQLLAVDDLHNKLMPVVLKRIDTAHATITRAIEAQEAELRKGFTSTSQFAAEIRAHCKSLPLGERMKLISTATTDGDMTTLAAVLGAPSYLSGLDAKMAEALTERANAVRSPLTTKRLALLRNAQTKLEAAGSIAIGNYEAMIGSRHTTVSRLRVQRDKIKTVINGLAPAA